MHQGTRVRLAEGMAHLLEPVHRAPRLDGPELIDEVFEIHSLQQLHGVVETAVRRDAEIEQLDRVRRAQARGHLCLAHEALHHGVALLHRALERFGKNQLHGRRPREEQVPRLPHLAHAAEREALEQLVAAHGACSRDLSVRAVHCARGDRSDRDRDSPGRKGPPVIGGARLDGAAGRQQPQAARHGQRAQNGDPQRGTRGDRDQQRKENDDRDDPGQRRHVRGAKESGPGDGSRDHRREQHLCHERDPEHEPIRDPARDCRHQEQQAGSESEHIVRKVDRALEPAAPDQRAQQQRQERHVGQRAEERGDGHAAPRFARDGTRQLEGYGLVGPERGKESCGRESRHAASPQGRTPWCLRASLAGREVGPMAEAGIV